MPPLGEAAQRSSAGGGGAGRAVEKGNERKKSIALVRAPLPAPPLTRWRGALFGGQGIKKYKILTIRYSETIQNFADEELCYFVEHHEAQIVSAKFFRLGGMPAWTIIIEYNDVPRVPLSSTMVPASEARTSVSSKKNLPSPILETLSPEEKMLYEELRKWRNLKAKGVGYSPCIFFTNDQLAHMAKEKPCSLQKFGELPGVGEAKLAEHGPTIIAIVKDFVRRREMALKPVPLLPPAAPPVPAVAEVPPSPRATASVKPVISAIPKTTEESPHE